MATVREIQDCFAALRDKLAQHTASRSTSFPQIAGDAKESAELARMALFIGESVVVDIKRIADAQERIAQTGEAALDMTSAAYVQAGMKK